MARKDEDEHDLEQLKRAHLDAGPSDPRWEALTMGTLTADEAEALRTADPGMYERFRPFTEDERARIAAGVEAMLDIASAAASGASPQERER